MAPKHVDTFEQHLATVLGIMAGDTYNQTPPMRPPEFLRDDLAKAAEPTVKEDSLKTNDPNAKLTVGSGAEGAGRAAYAAGFRGEALVNMIAIAGRESSYDPMSVGDVGLQDNTWGPSVGLFQIRTVKADTGTGGPRDIQYLTGNPIAQAQAAWKLSNGGTDFGPWRLHGGGFLDRTNVDEARRIASLIESSGG